MELGYIHNRRGTIIIIYNGPWTISVKQPCIFNFSKLVLDFCQELKGPPGLCIERRAGPWIKRRAGPWIVY